jgi:hypothetical protein
LPLSVLEGTNQLENDKKEQLGLYIELINTILTVVQGKYEELLADKEEQDQSNANSNEDPQQQFAVSVCFDH